MVVLQVILALGFVATMVVAKKKWIILVGWLIVFLLGIWLYCGMYSAEAGRIDAGIVLASIMAAVRGFFINNDFDAYADKTNASTYLLVNIVYFLSVFMTALTTAKIAAAYYSDRLRLLFYGNRRHICVFTESSRNTIHLARSVKRFVKNPLCVFVDCDRLAEFEGEKNVLFLKTSEYAHLKKYKSEVFICSEDMAKNKRVFNKIQGEIPSAAFYVFSNDCVAPINRDELLVRYLFVTNRFVPKSYSGNKPIKIYIVGDNALALELCKELIVHCQSAEGLPQITIIGANAEDNFAFFVKSSPGLSNCAELIFVNENPLSVAGIDAITNGKFDLLVICDENKKLSMFAPPEKVLGLPDYEVIYDYNIIACYSLDNEAKELNAEYERLISKSNKPIDVDAKWKELSEFHRQSNRSQAISISTIRYCRSIGMTNERLAEEEHMRWNAFHYINGWIYGMNPDGKKDMHKKLHPCLVPYNELSQSERDKDIMFVNKILEGVAST